MTDLGPDFAPARAPGYIPAFRIDALTPLYDPVQRWLVREPMLKPLLASQGDVRPGLRVLDVGCGTGTLAILMKRRCPDAEIIGLDGDMAVLKRAQVKAARAGVEVAFHLALAGQLPYPTASFDRVMSSLFFHHLTRSAKHEAAGDMFRVLRPGGELHVMDFGAPRGLAARAVGQIIRHFEQVADHIDGRLPGVFQLAGFTEVAEVERHMTLVGMVTFYRARKEQ